MALLVCACADGRVGPITPSLPANPRLSSGSYFFSVRPLPGFAGCTGAWTDGTASRVGLVILVEDQGEWLARPDSPAAGDLTMRLEEAASGAVTGSIRRELVTSRGPDNAVRLGVTFGTSSGAGALVTGTALDDLDQAFGRIDGVLTFVDEQQPAPMICSAGQWTLIPSTF
jgi:hypothetical protein